MSFLYQPQTTAKLRLLRSAALLAALWTGSSALAQRAGENAVRSAEDAFGSSIGDESIGLYSPNSVRGFSPFSAGNVRLEGLYYDAVTGFNGRLIRGSTVRVGISAQGYPFPAPTGIADYRLRVPGDKPSLSLVAAADTFGGATTQIDGQIPLIADRVSLSAGAHRSHDKYDFGGGGVHSSAALILKIRPAPGIELIPFWSGFRHHGMDNPPILSTSGKFLPPEVPRGRYFTQHWAKYKGVDQNSGIIIQSQHGATSFTGGIFRSTSTNRGTFTDFFDGISPEGVAQQHLITASPAQKFTSTSGELKFSHNWQEGSRLHTLIVAARSRDRRRRYGGSDTVQLGPVLVEAMPTISEPDFHFGAYARDRVRQQSFGLAYRGQWKNKGELSLGLQRVRYRKDVVRPGSTLPATKDSPWLFNAGLTTQLSSKLAVYGSFTKGLEESPVAPSFASNRDEAPPAIMTQQMDAGARLNIGGGFKLVAGAFDVKKPYFSIDAQRRYRQLGEVRNRGVEISLTGNLGSRISIVAGAILMHARVSGEEVAKHLVGSRPVGSVPSNILVSADYQLPLINGLSATVTLQNLGKQPANSSNSLFVPNSLNMDAGVRYVTKLAGHPVSFRIDAGNVLNTYSWAILGSNAYFYEPQRQVSFRITSDL